MIVNSAFSHDVLELSNNSEPIQLNNDAVVVLRVKQHLLSQKQDLEAVSDRIRQILAEQQAEKKAKEVGMNLIKSTGENQQHIMDTHQFTWSSIENASRDNDKTSALINELAFTILRPGNLDGVVLENGDYAVVKLKHIINGDLDALDKEHKESLIQQIETNYGMMDYEIYVNSLMKEAKLEKN